MSHEVLNKGSVMMSSNYSSLTSLVNVDCIDRDNIDGKSLVDNNVDNVTF